MTADIYAVIAELWCNPQDVDDEDLARDAASAITTLRDFDPESAELLSRFLRQRVSVDDYIDLFELSPKCSLYLGSHVFEEPKTCAQAGVSDRNGFMIELLGIYQHFKLQPNGKELPDYLPLIVELLALTAGSPDPMRGKLINEYVVPYLSPLRARLDELSSSYRNLLDVFERILKLDIETSRTVVDHA